MWRSYWCNAFYQLDNQFYTRSHHSVQKWTWHPDGVNFIRKGHFQLEFESRRHSTKSSSTWEMNILLYTVLIYVTKMNYKINWIFSCWFFTSLFHRLVRSWLVIATQSAKVKLFECGVCNCVENSNYVFQYSSARVHAFIKHRLICVLMSAFNEMTNVSDSAEWNLQKVCGVDGKREVC